MGAQEGLRGLSYKKGLGKVAVSLAGAPRPGPDPDRVSPLWPQVGKLRERLQEAKLEREQEQRRHTAYISELRAKLHEEKTKELQALREVPEVQKLEAGPPPSCWPWRGAPKISARTVLSSGVPGEKAGRANGC